MDCDARATRGRFWVLRDANDASDGEPAIDELALAAPAVPTLGDALLCARDLRGAKKQRADKQARREEMEEHLRRRKQEYLARRAAPTQVPVMPTWRYSQVSLDRRRSSENPAMSASVDDSDSNREGEDWFRMIRGKAIPETTLNRAPESSRRRDDRLAPPPTSRSPVRKWGDSGDDVTIREGIFLSIRTLGRCGPPNQTLRCATDAGHVGRQNTVGSASSRMSDRHRGNGHLSTLFRHIWAAGVRVPEGVSGGRGDPPKPSKHKIPIPMGDRYQSNNGGGGGGPRGSGPGGRGRGNFQNSYGGGYQRSGNSSSNFQYSNQRAGSKENFVSTGILAVGGQKLSNDKQIFQPVQNQSKGNDTQVVAVDKLGDTVDKQMPSSKAGGDKAAPISQGRQQTDVDLDKVQCFKCWVKGHHTKECKTEVLCVNCDKESHISSKCTWLKQRKPVATMVGFGAEGLGCFVAEHAKEPTDSAKKNCAAIIKIKEDTSIEVSEMVLEQHLGRTYPWKWTWKAKEIKHGVFMVDFPSLEKITEASIYEWVPLRGAQIWINVQKWTEDILASGKMTVVWIQAKRVPRELKNFHGLHEIGSTLGQVLEVDMETLKKNGSVFCKVGVVDVDMVPQFTKITTPKLLIYHIPVKVVEVVEEGWLRPNEELQLDFDSIEEVEDRVEDDRDPKRQRGTENAQQTPNKKLDEAAVIQASARTIKALEHREQALKEQDAMDVVQYGNLDHAKNKSDHVDLSDRLAQKGEEDGQEYDVSEGDDEAAEDVEQTENDISDSQESLGTKMERIMPGCRGAVDR
ncbi:hypothetical protein ACQ4PT_060571 [Festuca glaucescens]